METLIPQATLDKLLAVYEPKARYLQSAHVDYPISYGRFHIPASVYVQNTGHLNAVDALICFNQLASALIGVAWTQGSLEGLDRITEDDFSKYQLGRAYILKVKNFTFNGSIDATDFGAHLQVEKAAVRNGLYYFFTSVSFEDGKIVGDFVLGLKVA